MATVDEIKALQALLNGTLAPPPGLAVDGIMGPRTRAALARYQALKMRINQGDSGRLITAADTPGPPGAPSEPESDAWMAIAEGELGTAEVPGANHNQRIIAYHGATSLEAQSDEVPWCSSFVNWVMREAGFTGTNNALAKSWASWGVATTPRYGAITVIKRRHADKDAATGSSTGFHVGFLVAKTADRIRLLGGNQGDMVKLSNFLLGSYEVRAYRWPR